MPPCINASYPFIHYKKNCNMIFQKWGGGGLKAVWNFSKNSSDLVVLVSVRVRSVGAMLGGVVFTAGSLVLRADAGSRPTFRNVIQYCMKKEKRKLFFVQECLFLQLILTSSHCAVLMVTNWLKMLGSIKRKWQLSSQAKRAPHCARFSQTGGCLSDQSHKAFSTGGAIITIRNHHR